MQSILILLGVCIASVATEKLNDSSYEVFDNVSRLELKRINLSRAKSKILTLGSPYTCSLDSKECRIVKRCPEELVTANATHVILEPLKTGPIHCKKYNEEISFLVLALVRVDAGKPFTERLDFLRLNAKNPDAKLEVFDAESTGVVVRNSIVSVVGMPPGEGHFSYELRVSYGENFRLIYIKIEVSRRECEAHLRSVVQVTIDSASTLSSKFFTEFSFVNKLRVINCGVATVQEGNKDMNGVCSVGLNSSPSFWSVSVTTKESCDRSTARNLTLCEGFAVNVRSNLKRCDASRTNQMDRDTLPKVPTITEQWRTPTTVVTEESSSISTVDRVILSTEKAQMTTINSKLIIPTSVSDPDEEETSSSFTTQQIWVSERPSKHARYYVFFVFLGFFMIGASFACIVVFLYRELRSPVKTQWIYTNDPSNIKGF